MSHLISGCPTESPKDHLFLGKSHLLFKKIANKSQKNRIYFSKKSQKNRKKIASTFQKNRKKIAKKSHLLFKKIAKKSLKNRKKNRKKIAKKSRKNRKKIAILKILDAPDVPKSSILRETN